MTARSRVGDGVLAPAGGEQKRVTPRKVSRLFAFHSLHVKRRASLAVASAQAFTFGCGFCIAQDGSPVATVAGAAGPGGAASAAAAPAPAADGKLPLENALNELQEALLMLLRNDSLPRFLVRLECHSVLATHGGCVD